MRMRSTRERRKDREEFVYMHRAEIVRLLLVDDHKPLKETREIEIFAEQARVSLTYSVRTYWVDIWLTLRRDYFRLFPDSTLNKWQ